MLDGQRQSCLMRLSMQNHVQQDNSKEPHSPGHCFHQPGRLTTAGLPSPFWKAKRAASAEHCKCQAEKGAFCSAACATAKLLAAILLEETCPATVTCCLRSSHVEVGWSPVQDPEVLAAEAAVQDCFCAPTNGNNGENWHPAVVEYTLLSLLS